MLSFHIKRALCPEPNVAVAMRSSPLFAERPPRGEKIFSSRGKNGNVALLPVAYLNFVYTLIFHPAPTSPDLLPLYRPLAEESIGIGHLHPTFSSFSLFFSIYSLGRIYTPIYIARTRYTQIEATGNKATFPLNRFQGYAFP